MSGGLCFRGQVVFFRKGVEGVGVCGVYGVAFRRLFLMILLRVDLVEGACFCNQFNVALSRMVTDLVFDGMAKD